ncbi:hypothetical protein OKW42_006182 [Paraburkholderia sp. WC7.3d]
MRMYEHSLSLHWQCLEETIARAPRDEDGDTHFAGAGRALLPVGGAVQVHCARRAQSHIQMSVRECARMRRPGSCGLQVRSEGSVFFAGVRMSGDNCAKIHDEQAVMTPTHRNVA